MKKLLTGICLFSLIFIFSANEGISQELSAGINIGGGNISGNTVNIGSYNLSLFIQSKSYFEDNMYLRLSMLYAQDINLPLGSTRNYYPFIKGLSLKAILFQDAGSLLYFEEGAGLLYLNDRTLSYKNTNDFGTVFSILTGLDLTGFDNRGIKLGLGMEYGITFNNTLAKYYSLYLQTQYFF